MLGFKGESLCREAPEKNYRVFSRYICEFLELSEFFRHCRCVLGILYPFLFPFIIGLADEHCSCGAEFYFTYFTNYCH